VLDCVREVECPAPHDSADFGRIFFMRDTTIIYRSFYEAIKDLPAENQAELWVAIFEFSLNFNEVELTGLSKTVFKLIKPQLEANNKRFENGKKPKAKQEISKPEAKHKQVVSKSEANNNNNNNNNNNLDTASALRSEQFEKFWEFYGKHGAKKPAKQRFMKLTETEMEALRKHLPKYLDSTPDIKFRKHAERYLSSKLWENGDIENLSKPVQYWTNPFDYWNRDLTPEEWKRVPPDRVEGKKDNDIKRRMGI